MTDTYHMVHIAQSELQELVGEDGSCIRETEQGMVRKDRPQSHCTRMEDSLLTETAQASMSMDNLNLFADDNVSKYGEERKDGGHRRLAVDDEEGHMVDLESVCEVADPSATLVRMGDDNDFVSAVDQLLDWLIRSV